MHIIHRRSADTSRSEVGRWSIFSTRCYTQDQYAQAGPLYKRSLAIWERVLGPDYPNVAQSLENIAALYRATKR